MNKTVTMLLATALLTPLTAVGDTLELPADARVEFELIDALTLGEDATRRDDIVMQPVIDGDGSHQLPEHCVVIGSASLEDERIRLSAHSMTCIETDGADSEIYSSDISAAAYEADGSYGLAACQGGRCELGTDRGFLLQFMDGISIEQQVNPSAELNEQRRQAEGEGVANPIPAEAPAPDEE